MVGQSDDGDDVDGSSFCVTYSFYFYVCIIDLRTVDINYHTLAKCVHLLFKAITAARMSSKEACVMEPSARVCWMFAIAVYKAARRPYKHVTSGSMASDACKDGISATMRSCNEEPAVSGSVMEA